jgi:CRP-like cAMP-binding protein
VEVDAGTVLATEGEHAYEVFVIESGEAEVRKGGELIRTLRAGEAFGEIGLLATGTRTASVTATTPMKLVAIFSREFKQIQTRMPQIAQQLRASMRERVARTSF